MNTLKNTCRFFLVFVAAVLHAPAPAGARPAEGAALRYSFDRVEDGKVPDLSGNGYHGIIEGGIEEVEGGLRLVDDGYVEAGAVGAMNVGSGPFTVEMLIELEHEVPWSSSGDGIARLLGAGYDGHSAPLSINIDGEGYVMFNVRTPEDAWRGSRSDFPLPVGKPVHIAAVLDGESPRAMRRELYINGVLQQESASGPAMELNSNDFYRIGTNVPGGRHLKGILRELRLYPEGMRDEVIRRGRGYAPEEEKAAGQVARVILDPYRFVDWDSWGRYKSNLHSHTKLHKLEADGSVIEYGAPGYEKSEGVAYGSDGSHLPCEVIDEYREYGFDILAITDHDPFYGYGELQESYPGRTTYPWTLWGRDPEELGMIAVEGQELTNPHGALGPDYEHDVSLFNDLGGTDQHKTGYDREERIHKVSNRMGLLMLAHPRGVVTASELAEQAERHNASRLIEVFTRADSTDARRLWDEALGLTMPFLPVWGVSVDDMHSFSQLGTNYCVHLMPRFDAGAVRHSLERGEFYFTMDPVGNDPDRHNPVKAPVITGIRVSGTEIRISGKNYDRISWISAGRRIAEGETIDVSEARAGNYVRAELHGSYGAVTCTQPFGIIHAGEQKPR